MTLRTPERQLKFKVIYCYRLMDIIFVCLHKRTAKSIVVTPTIFFTGDGRGKINSGMFFKI